MFLWTPGTQTSASNWLTRFIWKEIFPSNLWGSFSQKFRTVFEKCYLKGSVVMLLECHFRHIWLYSISMFLWPPGSQTSASNWLTRFIWKEIFSSIQWRSISQKFRAVLKKYDLKESNVMSVDYHFRHILLYSRIDVSMNARHTNQRVQLAD